MTDDAKPPGLTTIPPAGPERQAWLKKFAKLWGFAIFVLVVAFWFRGVLLPFVLAVAVAYILAPLINRLSSYRVHGRTLPRGAAVLICYVVLLASLGLFFTAFLPRLSSDFARMGREAPNLWARVNQEWTPRVATWLEARFPSLKVQPTLTEVNDSAPPLLAPSPPPGAVASVRPLPGGDFAVTLGEQGLEIEKVDEGHVVIRPRQSTRKKGLEAILRERIVKAVSGLEGEVADLLRFGQAIVTGVISILMKFVLVLMVAAFILIDLEKLHAFARGLIPERYRGDYDHIVGGMDRGLSGVIRGQLLICLVNGVLTYVGLLIFQVKYGLLLAALAAVMSLIPIFGSILSSIPIVGIALVSGTEGMDLLRSVFVLLWILGIHFVEANFLNPHIIGTAAKMHPVLVIFSLIAGEHTYGLVGALLAVPVASMIQTLFVYFRSRAWKVDAVAPVKP